MARTIAKRITAPEARVLAGKALFGDDWIGQLPPSDLKLMESEFGVKRKSLPNGRTINIIVPCPTNRRGQLDLAIGRGERAYVQLSTAIDVMHDAGFSDLSETYDLEAFSQFLEKFCAPASKGRSVGKPRDKIEGVMRRMESDMRGGLDLNALKGKELAVKYRVSRNTAVAARREVLEKQDRK